MKRLTSNRFLFGVFLLFLIINVFLIFYLLSLPRPGRCLVLEERYCQKGKVIYHKGKPWAVGFLLPENTPVFSPFDGDLSPITIVADKKHPYPGLSVDTGRWGKYLWQVKRSFTAVFLREKMSPTNDSSIKKGAVLGKLRKDKLESFGDYNLIVYFSKPDKTHLYFSFDREFTFQVFALDRL